jgi:hypothetical protein
MQQHSELAQALSKLSEADSGVIVLIIVVGLLVYFVAGPMYSASVRSKERQLEQWIQREAHMLEVIKQNSDASRQVAEAVASIKGLLEGTQAQCDTCQASQQEALAEINTKLDDIKTLGVAVATTLKVRSEVHPFGVERTQ